MDWSKICTTRSDAEVCLGGINVEYLIRVNREFVEKFGKAKRTVIVSAMGEKYAVTGTEEQLRPFLETKWPLTEPIFFARTSEPNQTDDGAVMTLTFPIYRSPSCVGHKSFGTVGQVFTAPAEGLLPIRTPAELAEYARELIGSRVGYVAIDGKVHDAYQIARRVLGKPLEE